MASSSPHPSSGASSKPLTTLARTRGEASADILVFFDQCWSQRIVTVEGLRQREELADAQRGQTSAANSSGTSASDSVGGGRGTSRSYSRLQQMLASSVEAATEIAVKQSIGPAGALSPAASFIIHSKKDQLRRLATASSMAQLKSPSASGSHDHHRPQDGAQDLSAIPFAWGGQVAQSLAVSGGAEVLSSDVSVSPAPRSASKVRRKYPGSSLVNDSIAGNITGLHLPQQSGDSTGATLLRQLAQPQGATTYGTALIALHQLSHLQQQEAQSRQTQRKESGAASPARLGGSHSASASASVTPTSASLVTTTAATTRQPVLSAAASTASDQQLQQRKLSGTVAFRDGSRPGFEAQKFGLSTESLPDFTTDPGDAAAHAVFEAIAASAAADASLAGQRHPAISGATPVGGAMAMSSSLLNAESSGSTATVFPTAEECRDLRTSIVYKRFVALGGASISPGDRTNSNNNNNNNNNTVSACHISHATSMLLDDDDDDDNGERHCPGGAEQPEGGSHEPDSDSAASFFDRSPDRRRRRRLIDSLVLRNDKPLDPPSSSGSTNMSAGSELTADDRIGPRAILRSTTRLPLMHAIKETNATMVELLNARAHREGPLGGAGGSGGGGEAEDDADALQQRLAEMESRFIARALDEDIDVLGRMIAANRQKHGGDRPGGATKGLGSLFAELSDGTAGVDGNGAGSGGGGGGSGATNGGDVAFIRKILDQREHRAQQRAESQRLESLRRRAARRTRGRGSNNGSESFTGGGDSDSEEEAARRKFFSQRTVETKRVGYYRFAHLERKDFDVFVPTRTTIDIGGQRFQYAELFRRAQGARIASGGGGGNPSEGHGANSNGAAAGRH